jgi:hypothetical protein
LLILGFGGLGGSRAKAALTPTIQGAALGQ